MGVVFVNWWQKVDPSYPSVLRATNITDHRVVACTLIKLTEGTSEKNRKSVEKEMQIRATLKHTKSAVVELKHQATYVPGIYMLLESEEGVTCLIK